MSVLFLLDALLPDWWLPACIGALVCFPLLTLAALTAGFRAWHLPQHTPVDNPATLPGDVRRQTQPWIGRLGFLGFAFQSCSRSQDENGKPCHLWRMASVKDRSIGVMKVQFPSPKARPILSLTLYSFLPDGGVIITADRPIAPCLPEHWQAIHRRYTTLEGQIQDHLARLEGLPVIVIPNAQIEARLAVEDQAVVEALLASGHYLPLPEGQTGAKPALTARPLLAWKRLTGIFARTPGPSGRRSDVAAAAKKGDEEFEAKTPARDRSAAEAVEDTLAKYRELTTLATNAKYYFTRLGPTVLTLGLCLLIAGEKSALQTAQIVLGLLALHEFGHWLMLRIFGFQGMGRMFIPFFNPLDRARKLHAPAWQQLAVILAGPLPGLLAGIAIMAAGSFVPLPDWVLDVGGFALMLNAFHLMPFLPLDGGKVVDLLIFRDLPFLRPLFTAASGLLVLLGWFSSGARPLLYIGLGMLGGLAWDIKMIRVVRGGRRLGWKDATDEDETLRRIFTGIREEGNDEFFSDRKWHRQIEVLLAEVMRKRPGFLLRIMGGGAYLASWVLAVLVLLSVWIISESGSPWHRQQMAAYTEEFRDDFPKAAQEVTEEQAKPFRALEEKSSAGMDTAALDHFDWPSASRVVNAGMIREDTFAIWMNALTTRMEKAEEEGRGAEALRRAEMLLYARGAMEPAATLRIRRALWDSELRCYDAIEKLAAAGQFDEATLSRINARLTALGKNLVPAIEGRLLVDGNIWMDGQGSAFDAAKPVDGEAVKEQDQEPPFWRFARERRTHLLNHALPFREDRMASAAVARHWKETGKVEELPLTLAGADIPFPGEAAYILDFFETHQRVAWRRMATSGALRLEEYRLKKGELPQTASYNIMKGAATLKLEGGDKPKFVLQDQREITKLMPPWMKLLRTMPEPIHHECPLHPSTSLSQK